jgi:hypothetical protein
MEKLELLKITSSKGQEFLAKITDNDKLALSQETKEKIVTYCIQRIEYACGIEPTKIIKEATYRLSTDFMNKFLEHKSLLSALNKKPQDVYTHTDMRCLYYFTQMVEESTISNKNLNYYLAHYTKTRNITIDNRQFHLQTIERITIEQDLNTFNPATKESNIIKLKESIKLAESILLALQEDVKLAKDILLLKNENLDAKQLPALINNLEQSSVFISTIDAIFNHVCENL